MARSTREGIKRIWASLKDLRHSLQVVGFSDTLESINGGAWSVCESAESKSVAFIKSNPNAIILHGVKTAEEAIEKSRGGNT